MKNKYSFKLGDFTCTIFNDLLFNYQGVHYFLDIDEDVTAKALAHYGQTPTDIPSPFVCVLLEKDNQKILIDTGVGYNQNPVEFQGGKVEFMGQMARLLDENDIAGEEITHVILSHFHPDHIGGICHEDGSIQFPNAQFIAHQDEWDFWMGSNADSQPPLFSAFIERNIHPLKDGDLRLISGEDTEIMSGITALTIPGHTPGQIALRIESKGQKLLYISDAWLHPLHIAHLDWRTSYDINHEQARDSRIKMLELAHEEEMLVQSFHFDFPGMGRVDRSANGWKWLPG